MVKKFKSNHEYNLHRHNELISRTNERLEDKLQTTQEFEYKLSRGIEGEVDLIAYNPKTANLYLFEMKKTNTYKAYSKSINQLKRAEKHLVPRFQNDGMVINKVIPIFCSYYPNGSDRMYFHNINVPLKTKDYKLQLKKHK